MAWEAAVSEWLENGRTVLGWRPDTARTRREHLVHLARGIEVPNPWAVTEKALLVWWHAQRWAAETRRGKRASLRGFYSWGAEAGHVERSPALRLPRVKPTSPNVQPVDDHAYRLARVAASHRERLMLRLALEVGLRRGEVARVHSNDLERDLGGWSLVVHGKGGKDRLVPLGTELAAELRALPPGWAFPGDDGGHLSPRWVGTLIGRLLPEGYTMHGLRHRFGTDAWEVEGDLAIVQELLGHSSVNTTRLYVHVPKARLRATVEEATRRRAVC